jgi:DNA-binding NarL/FixJ family response regulator
VTAGRDHWWCSRLAHFAGHREEAVALAREAVRLLEGLDEMHEAYARWWVGVLQGDRGAIERWGLVTAELARPRGELGIAAHALNRVAMVRWAVDPGQGELLMQESLALAREGGSLEQTARVYNNLAYELTLDRDVDEAERWFDEGLAWTSEQDLTFWWDTMVDSRSLLRLFAGDWGRALQDVRTVLSSPRAAPGMQACARVADTLIRLRRGEPGVAERIDGLAENLRAASVDDRLLLLAVRAEAAWVDGTGDAAVHQALTTTVTQLGGASDWRLAEPALFWLLRLDPQLLVDMDADVLRRPLALELAGDRMAAVAAWSELGSPFEAAVVRAGSDDPDELRAAFEVLGDLGATTTVAALRRDAAARGVRTVPRGVRPSTRRDPLGLTSRQAEVLDLLADGLTNGEIAERLVISPKTAEHHVSAVLARLGASTRGQAVAIARERRG